MSLVKIIRIAPIDFSNNNLPGKDVSLDGILNFSEKRFAEGPGIWSDEPLVLIDDKELAEEVRESFCRKNWFTHVIMHYDVIIDNITWRNSEDKKDKQ